MPQVSARIPESLLESLDQAASALKCSRAAIIRQAIESYTEDFEDISVALNRLNDPRDASISWQDARRALLKYTS